MKKLTITLITLFFVATSFAQNENIENFKIFTLPADYRVFLSETNNNLEKNYIILPAGSKVYKHLKSATFYDAISGEEIQHMEQVQLTHITKTVTVYVDANPLLQNTDPCKEGLVKFNELVSYYKYSNLTLLSHSCSYSQACDYLKKLKSQYPCLEDMNIAKLNKV